MSELTELCQIMKIKYALITTSNQTAFKRHSSTEPVAYSMVIYLYIKRGSPVLAYLFNSSHAYNFGKLWKFFKIFAFINIPSCILRFLVFLYVHQACRVSLDTIYFDPFQVSNAWH